jgi:von Willebrand factor type A domain
MREVSRSLIALCLVTAACGSDVAQTGDPVEMQNGNSTAGDRDGGAAKPGKTDAGKDAGKGGGTSAAGKDASSAPVNCGKNTFSTGSVIPDMLIVLDRSGSMKPGGPITNLRCDNIGAFDFVTRAECAAAGIDCRNDQDKMTVYCGGAQQPGPVDRWTPSVSAVKTLTARFDADVAFGLVTFPARSNECGPGDFKVPIGLNTSGDIANVLDNTSPGGGTPTGETLQAALQSFKDSESGADTIPPARYVLLVTDGQPTCPNSNGGSNSPDRLQADKQFTLDAIDALNDYGVKTFVVGYDAELDPNLSTALKEFAQHGGTDDYYPVQNEDSLVTAFESISQKVVTCAFEFKESIADPALLRVTLDNVTLKPNDPNGWVLDGQTITIQGDSCAKLQEKDANHHVELVLECEPVVYL